jgi:hypothetical protein
LDGYYFSVCFWIYFCRSEFCDDDLVLLSFLFNSNSMVHMLAIVNFVLIFQQSTFPVYYELNKKRAESLHFFPNIWHFCDR